MAPLFDYKGLLPSGKASKGIIEADSIRTARVKLKTQGLIVTDIQEKKAQKDSETKQSFLTHLFSGVSANDVALSTKQLATLVKANIPIVEALNALVEQTENQKFRVILSQVRQDVNEGVSLAKALTLHPKAFDTIFVSMIEAGETSGTLGHVLNKLAELKETQVRLKNKLISAMTYPAFTLAASLMLLLGIFTFAIPKITKIFEARKAPLPPITRIMIFFSRAILEYWHLLIVAVFILAVLFSMYIKTPAGKERWDALKMRVPVLGRVIRTIAVTRFASTMATLLESGVPIIASLNIAKNVVDNVPISKAISVARENITEGQSIAQPLGRSGEFPPMMIHMVSIGEKTGDLPKMLSFVAETYEDQVNTNITALTSIIEPLLIVIMGGMIGTVILSVMLPLFQLLNQVQK